MADEDDNKKLSRRERRRAQQAAEHAGEGTSAEAELDEGQEPAEEDEASAEGAAADEGADESSTDASGEAAPDAEAARKPSKTEKKRAKQQDKLSAAQIRDRNKRLREEAAGRRRGKREKERDTARARGLDAGEIVDDALARGTHTAWELLKRHSTAVQWLAVLTVAGGLGWQIWSWRSGKQAAAASDTLMTAVDSELGVVGTEPPGDPERAQLQSRPSFPTEEARLEAASKAYDEAARQREGTGTGILAALGKAGVLYDQGKFDEAKTAYDAVRSSPLAKHDPDVRLRATEGVGLALEAKGDAEGAASAFKELEQSEELGFAPLGLYHQARLLTAKGEKDKAKELLAKLNDKLAKDRSPHQTGGYLEKAGRDLMGILDPSTVVATSSYTPEQMQALQEQILKDPAKLKKMLEDMGKMKAPDLPPPMPVPDLPVPSPESPPPETPAPPPGQGP